MDKAELLQTLENLHQYLSTAEEIDPESERKLRDVTADVHRLLESDETAERDSASLSGAMRSMLLDWEADHPQVAQLIGKAANTLANLGI